MSNKFRVWKQISKVRLKSNGQHRSTVLSEILITPSQTNCNAKVQDNRSTDPFKVSQTITCPTNTQVQSKPPGVNTQQNGWRFHDTQTGILFGIPKSARCVQRFDDSLNSAIHITYRISLRSSSMREPRDPLLKVLLCYNNDYIGYIDVW